MTDFGGTIKRVRQRRILYHRNTVPARYLFDLLGEPLPRLAVAALPHPPPAAASSPRSARFRAHAIAGALARSGSPTNTATASARQPSFWNCRVRPLPLGATQESSCQLRQPHCQAIAQHLKLAPPRHLAIYSQRRTGAGRELRTHNRLYADSAGLAA